MLKQKTSTTLCDDDVEGENDNDDEVALNQRGNSSNDSVISGLAEESDYQCHGRVKSIAEIGSKINKAEWWKAPEFVPRAKLVKNSQSFDETNLSVNAAESPLVSGSVFDCGGSVEMTQSLLFGPESSTTDTSSASVAGYFDECVSTMPPLVNAACNGFRQARFGVGPRPQPNGTATFVPMAAGAISAPPPFPVWPQPHNPLAPGDLHQSNDQTKIVQSDEQRKTNCPSTNQQSLNTRPQMETTFSEEQSSSQGNVGTTVDQVNGQNCEVEEEEEDVVKKCAELIDPSIAYSCPDLSEALRQQLLAAFNPTKCSARQQLEEKTFFQHRPKKLSLQSNTRPNGSLPRDTVVQYQAGSVVTEVNSSNEDSVSSLLVKKLNRLIPRATYVEDEMADDDDDGDETNMFVNSVEADEVREQLFFMPCELLISGSGRQWNSRRLRTLIKRFL
ncbi:conserved hypothetical protein [Trichinella spiralis]|uniref:hypothetical protein n=1 Tax=Trichinella spiralis TaxID=6334 RepID=UPI0001EFCF05|nr:conserved hypothetical protein [Trichinella spiralis]